MNEHIPDEVLMDRVRMRLRKGAASIYELSLATNRHPKNVRQAVSDLMHYGEVVESRDGRRYQLTESGPVPPEVA